ncbi:hypothetical protein ACN47E_006682 [Coniothyrium glycines]
MGGKKNKHSYFYDRARAESLKSIALPEKIKCGRCSKNLGQARYSSKQLDDARFNIKTHGSITKPINCQRCTGQQIVELECNMCGKTKGLEAFAKTQAKNPDTAKCFKCMEEQLNEVPIAAEKYEDPTKAFITRGRPGGSTLDYFSPATSTEDSLFAEEWASVNGDATSKTGDDDDGGVRLSSQMRTLSMTGTISEDLIESEYAHGPVHFDSARRKRGEDVRSTTSWKTPHHATSIASGFYPDDYSASSATSASGSVQSFPSSIAERSTPDYRKNKWAKIKAAPRSASSMSSDIASVRPEGNSAHEYGSEQDPWKNDSDNDSEEEEEESDDDDDDYDSDDDTVI